MAETGLEKAEKRYAQAKARLQGIRNREATKRRKVILGGALLDLAERDSTAAAMLDRLVRNLPRQQDRKAFTDWDASGSSASPAPGSDADNPS